MPGQHRVPAGGPAVAVPVAAAGPGQGRKHPPALGQVGREPGHGGPVDSGAARASSPRQRPTGDPPPGDSGPPEASPAGASGPRNHPPAQPAGRARRAGPARRWADGQGGNPPAAESGPPRPGLAPAWLGSRTSSGEVCGLSGGTGATGSARRRRPAEPLPPARPMAPPRRRWSPRRRRTGAAAAHGRAAGRGCAGDGPGVLRPKEERIVRPDPVDGQHAQNARAKQMTGPLARPVSLTLATGGDSSSRIRPGPDRPAESPTCSAERRGIACQRRRPARPPGILDLSRRLAADVLGPARDYRGGHPAGAPRAPGPARRGRLSRPGLPARRRRPRSAAHRLLPGHRDSGQRLPVHHIHPAAAAQRGARDRRAGPAAVRAELLGPLCRGERRAGLALAGRCPGRRGCGPARSPAGTG